MAAYRVQMRLRIKPVGIQHPCVQTQSVFAVSSQGLTGRLEPLNRVTLFIIVLLLELLANLFNRALVAFDEQRRTHIASGAERRIAKREHPSAYGRRRGSGTDADMLDC